MAASNHDIGFLGKSFHNRQKETGFQGLAMWRVVPFIPVFFVHKKKVLTLDFTPVSPVLFVQATEKRLIAVMALFRLHTQDGLVAFGKVTLCKQGFRSVGAFISHIQ